MSPSLSLSIGRLMLVTMAVVVLLLPQLSLEGQQPTPAVQMIGDTGEGAKYWARWRGPSGQGVVTGTVYPYSW